jgi:hypothetical protein
MTKKLLPSLVGSSLYQILCTESDQNFVHEICETLCSLWTESVVMVDFTLTKSDLNTALNSFLCQLKKKERRCLEHCNLRHWLRFLSSLLTVQTKAYLEKKSLVSTLPFSSFQQSVPILFIAHEDLLWLLEGFLKLASDTTIMDLYGTRTDASDQVQSSPPILFLSLSHPPQYDPLLKASLHAALGSGFSALAAHSSNLDSLQRLLDDLLSGLQLELSVEQPAGSLRHSKLQFSAGQSSRPLLPHSSLSPQ